MIYQTKAPSFENMTADIEDTLKKIESIADAGDQLPQAPVREFKWLAEAGLLEIVLPGAALDFNEGHTAELLMLLKKVGKANLSIGRIYEGHINALYLIHLYGTKSQKHQWYNKVITEHALFGVWNTQVDSGVNYISSGQDLNIEGSKTFCSGAEIVTHALITGNIKNSSRTGWQMMILQMDKLDDNRIDRSTWQTMGMKASGSFTVDFSGYAVDDEELLGSPGQYLGQPYFNGGAIRFAAVQLGGAEAIASHTLAFLAGMDRTDDPIQKMRLAGIMTDITTGNLWIEQAGRNYDSWASQPEQNADLIAFANMTRTVIEEIGIKVMNESNRCVGARGLMPPFSLGRLNRDLTFYLRQPAPDATRINVAEYFINSFKNASNGI